MADIGEGVRDRIVELRRVPSRELRPHPRNWRTHPARQRQTIERLLADIGYAGALLAYVASDGELTLIDGHLRHELDAEQIVPVLVTDLDEAEADLVLATHDPVALLAGADPEAVASLHARVAGSAEEIRMLLGDVVRDAGQPRGGLDVDPDEIPIAASRARPGDRWRLGEHVIACADAGDRGVIDGLGPARVLWTDPPYGVSYVGKTKAALTIRNDDADSIDALLERAFASADLVLAPGSVVYVAHPAGPVSARFLAAFEAAGWDLRQTLVWVKDSMVLGHSDYHYRHEPILYGRKPGGGGRGRGRGGWYGGRAETSVFEIARPKASREHPTMKPVELVRRCLANSSIVGDVILDPFLGSGTTLIAAHQLGRRCVGVEVDPAYVDVAIARWERLTGGTATRD